MRKTISLITVMAVILTIVSLSGCSQPKSDEPSVTSTADEAAGSDKTVISCTYNSADGVSAPPEKEVNEILKVWAAILQ